MFPSIAVEWCASSNQISRQMPSAGDRKLFGFAINNCTEQIGRRCSPCAAISLPNTFVSAAVTHGGERHACTIGPISMNSPDVGAVANAPTP